MPSYRVEIDTEMRGLGFDRASAEHVKSLLAGLTEELDDNPDALVMLEIHRQEEEPTVTGDIHITQRGTTPIEDDEDE